MWFDWMREDREALGFGWMREVRKTLKGGVREFIYLNIKEEAT